MECDIGLTVICWNSSRGCLFTTHAKKETFDLGSGRTLHVRQEGAGPDLVLIHGAMTTSHTLVGMMVCVRVPGARWVAVLLSNDGNPTFPEAPARRIE